MSSSIGITMLMSVEEIARFDPPQREMKEGGEFRRLQSAIIIAIRDREWDPQGKLEANALYEKLKTDILRAQDIGDISPQEAGQLIEHLDALRTEDQEVWLRIMLEHDREFLQRDKPQLFAKAVLQDQFRRDNKVERACSLLEPTCNMRGRCARCLENKQDKCDRVCPARPAEEAPRELEQMVA